MKEQALNEILNLLDVRSDAIAFKDITYGRLIESAIEDGDALYKSINISRDVLSYWMKKTFPEKEEKNISWANYIISLAPYKRCGCCIQLLNYNYFSIDNSTWDKLQVVCKTCKSKNYANNAEHNKEYKKKNLDRTKTYNAMYWEKNKDIIKEYRVTNSEIYRAASAKYRATKLNATPKWADFKKINLIYKNNLSICHVDHIIPLQGKSVCGLHVENNLQSIPAKENLEKSNKFDPDYIEDLIMQELALDGLAYYEFEETLLDIAC